MSQQQQQPLPAIPPFRSGTFPNGISTTTSSSSATSSYTNSPRQTPPNGHRSIETPTVPSYSGRREYAISTPSPRSGGSGSLFANTPSDTVGGLTLQERLQKVRDRYEGGVASPSRNLQESLDRLRAVEQETGGMPVMAAGGMGPTTSEVTSRVQRLLDMVKRHEDEKAQLRRERDALAEKLREVNESQHLTPRRGGFEEGGSSSGTAQQQAVRGAPTTASARDTGSVQTFSDVIGGPETTTQESPTAPPQMHSNGSPRSVTFGVLEEQNLTPRRQSSLKQAPSSSSAVAAPRGSPSMASSSSSSPVPNINTTPRLLKQPLPETVDFVNTIKWRVTIPFLLADKVHFPTLKSVTFTMMTNVSVTASSLLQSVLKAASIRLDPVALNDADPVFEKITALFDPQQESETSTVAGSGSGAAVPATQRFVCAMSVLTSDSAKENDGDKTKAAHCSEHAVIDGEYPLSQFTMIHNVISSAAVKEVGIAHIDLFVLERHVGNGGSSFGAEAIARGLVLN